MKQPTGALLGGVECLDGFRCGLCGDLAAFGLKIGGGIGGKDGQATLAAPAAHTITAPALIDH